MFAGYKTIIANGIVLLLAAIELVAQIDIAGADETAITAGVLAVANLILRVVTKGRVGEEAPNPIAYQRYIENENADLEDALELTELQRDEAEERILDLEDE